MMCRNYLLASGIGYHAAPILVVIPPVTVVALNSSSIIQFYVVGCPTDRTRHVTFFTVRADDLFVALVVPYMTIDAYPVASR
jgi:hypothetical protein